MSIETKRVRWVGGPHHGTVFDVPAHVQYVEVQDQGIVEPGTWQRYPDSPVPTRRCPIVRHVQGPDSPAEFVVLWREAKEVSENVPPPIVTARRRIPADLRVTVPIETYERHRMLAECLKELGYYPRWTSHADSDDLELTLSLIPLGIASETVLDDPGAAGEDSRG